jgi:hypothetical protein
MEPIEGSPEGAGAGVEVRNGAKAERAPLGMLLIESGLLTDEELEHALALQAESGKLLGEILVTSGLVTKIELARALARQYGVELEEEGGYGSGLRSEIERRHLDERPGRPAGDAAAERDAAADADIGLPDEEEIPLLDLDEFDFDPGEEAAQERLTERERRLAELGEVLAETDALLERLEEQARAIVELEPVLETRGRLLGDIADGEARLAKLVRDAEEVHARLTAASPALAARRKRLAELEATLRGHESLLEEQASASAEIARSLTNGESRLAELGRALEERSARLDGSHDVLDALGERLDGHDAAVAQARERLDETEQRIVELERKRGANEGESNRLEAVLEERSERLGQLGQALEAHERVLAGIEEQATEAERLAPSLSAWRDVLDDVVGQLVAVASLAGGGADRRAGVAAAKNALSGRRDDVDRLERIDLQNAEIDYGVARFFPAAEARRYTALPLRLERGVAVVAIADPDERAETAVRRLLARDARFVLADRGLLRDAIAAAYGVEPDPVAA